MHRNLKPIIALIFALALLTAAALPALAQASGTLNLECSSFQWQVEGDNCVVTVTLDKQQMGVITLTADNPIQQINYKHGNCTMTGNLKMFSKKAWGQGKLDMNLMIGQGGSTYGHEGTVATW